MALSKFDVITLADVPALFAGAKRTIHSVFWHCSASDRPEHDSAKVMEAWHLERGFAEIGYNAFVRKDGTIELGRPWGRIPAAQYPYNPGTLAFCLHGLVEEKFTEAQKKVMHDLSHLLNKLKPGLRFRGHCEVSSKTCPVVDYASIIGIDRAGHIIDAEAPEKPVEGSKPAAMPTVSLFSKGPAVSALQTRLNELGAKLVVDGHFGRLTEEAVKKFQRTRKLTADGIVGPLTWEALKANG